MGIILTNTDLFKSVKQLAKEQERLENRILSAGGNVVRKHIRDALKRVLPNATKHNPDYKDTLMDAVRRGKPHDGEVKVHILGTQSKGSGTYRLRFFEYATKRYQTKIKGKTLKKKHYIGTLEKYNGFFQQGWNSARSDVEQKMKETHDKYIKQAWNNGR